MPSIDTNLALVLGGVIVALGYVLGQVAVKALELRFGNRHNSSAATDTGRHHEIDIRLEVVEANTAALRLAVNEMNNTMNTLLRQATNLIDRLDEDAKHVRTTLHSINNMLGPLPGNIATALYRLRSAE